MLQPRLTTVPRKAAHTSIQTILSRILLTIPNSERCDYSYASSSYECTCPPGLTLAPDGQVCQGGGEVKVTTLQRSSLPTRSSSSNFQTFLPKVTIKLLPMNCLWSPWSDWSKCSAECGEGEMVRERSVVLPAKNGGDFLTMDVSRAI